MSLSAGEEKNIPICQRCGERPCVVKAVGVGLGKFCEECAKDARARKQKSRERQKAPPAASAKPPVRLRDGLTTKGILAAFKELRKEADLIKAMKAAPNSSLLVPANKKRLKAVEQSVQATAVEKKKQEEATQAIEDAKVTRWRDHYQIQSVNQKSRKEAHAAELKTLAEYIIVQELEFMRKARNKELDEEELMMYPHNLHALPDDKLRQQAFYACESEHVNQKLALRRKYEELDKAAKAAEEAWEAAEAATESPADRAKRLEVFKWWLNPLQDEDKPELEVPLRLRKAYREIGRVPGYPQFDEIVRVNPETMKAFKAKEQRYRDIWRATTGKAIPLPKDAELRGEIAHIKLSREKRAREN